jgi:alkanesulfonate monooxygenase SsuD/methylene tetrahydromethanopterin reductase-like flavin-dependent oxidoreductase (luciferase family)
MVTTFSTLEKVIPEGGWQMRFTITHPMHSHPYNPELVTGSGIATVAAAEAAGFHGFGFTDHPAPSQRWLESAGRRAGPVRGNGFCRRTDDNAALVPNIVAAVPQPVRGGEIRRDAGHASDGRFTLAVGVGYLKREFTALGVDFDERAALFEEALEVIRAI